MIFHLIALGSLKKMQMYLFLDFLFNQYIFIGKRLSNFKFKILIFRFQITITFCSLKIIKKNLAMFGIKSLHFFQGIQCYQIKDHLIRS